MIQKDFNVEAMEEKIKINIEKGFTIDKIKIALREELIANRKYALTLEQRATELFDQIEYMEKRRAE